MTQFTRLEALAVAYLLSYNGSLNADELNYMLDGLPEYARSIFSGHIERIAPGLESLILLKDDRWAALIATAIVAHSAADVVSFIWDKIKDTPPA